MALILSCLLGMTLALDYGSNVVELTDANYQTEFPKHDFVFVNFYNPGWPICQRHAQPYKEAADELKKTNGRITMAAYDITTQTVLR